MQLKVKKLGCCEVLLESLDTAVSVNGLFVPARAVQSMLGHYSLNLCVWTHDDVFKLNLLGSATPLFYRGHFLVLCTSHQIRNVDPKDVSILTEDGEFAVTSSGYRAPLIGPEGMDCDLQDIVVFVFDDACEQHPSLRRRFFKLEDFPSDCWSDDIVVVLNYGYPSQEQLYELEDKNHLGSRCRSTALTFQSQPQDETLLNLKPLKYLTFDPDGLSGGPNFVIQKSRNDLKAFFAGVTVRGGKHNIYIVKSRYIRGLLDAAVYH